MTASHENRHGTRLHPPGEIAARISFLVGVAFSMIGPALVVVGVRQHQPVKLVSGVTCALAAAWLLRWLYRQRRLGLLARSLADFSFGPGPGSTGDARVQRLQAELEAMEARRGTAGFDPWEALRLRRELDEQKRQDST